VRGPSTTLYVGAPPEVIEGLAFTEPDKLDMVKGYTYRS